MRRHWASGVALVLTQHAIPHGQGLIDVSFYLTDGSAELDFYSYATLLLALGMLAVTAIWIRRLGPALTVIPWLVFYLSVRSQDGYFLLMTPLWLAAAATAPPSVFAHAWQPRIPSAARPIGRLASGGPRRLPGFASSRPARGDPPRAVTPVRVGRDRERRAARACRREHDLAWAARAGPVADERRCRERFDGRAGSRTSPLSTGQGVTPFWNAVGGPAQLAPRQEATYLLTAADKAGYAPGPNGYLLLRALDAMAR